MTDRPVSARGKRWGDLAKTRCTKPLCASSPSGLGRCVQSKASPLPYRELRCCQVPRACTIEGDCLSARLHCRSTCMHTCEIHNKPNNNSLFGSILLQSWMNPSGSFNDSQIAILALFSANTKAVCTAKYCHCSFYMHVAFRSILLLIRGCGDHTSRAAGGLAMKGGTSLEGRGQEATEE